MQETEVTIPSKQGAVGLVPAPGSQHCPGAIGVSQRLSYFCLAVLGFSFWFFMVVPFGTHRESYAWLAGVHNHGFAEAFSFISVTYRPLAQATTWLGFVILNPSVFPTSAVRQTLLQGMVYAMFLVAWWFIYSSAEQLRLFAIIAFVIGGVFFPGYVHLFHIYGLFYVPVMLVLGLLLLLYRSKPLYSREIWLSAAAILLAFWHPFATALFLGFYFGFWLDTFRQRSKAQNLQAVLILLACTITIVALVGIFGRHDVMVPFHTRLYGFLITYRTNEVNLAASLCAFLLSELVVFSMELTHRLKAMAFIVVAVLGTAFLIWHLPLLLLWFCTALIKVCRLRIWSLLFLMLTAVLLPIGAVIGAPVFGLFAVIIAGYVTCLGWEQGEEALSGFKVRYVAGMIVGAAIVVAMVRAGIEVPLVTKAARPLLAERERTFQLERMLAWLHGSEFCGVEVAFAENAGSPIDSVENAITRQNRPPAGIDDVRLFWDTALRCGGGVDRSEETEDAVLTFGGPALTGARPVFIVAGKYAGDATVWIQQKLDHGN
ncbi:MAG: hypothetical protein WB341_08565 [Terracidiphilus sp.]